ncbi:hypothetical protein ACVWYH_008181 [Bradyrhizobium sp. GM24.11]
MQAIQTPTTRRQFSKWLAAATAGAGAAAVAAPVTTLAAAPSDDSPLLQLHEQIFEAWWAANEHNDEIHRLIKARDAKYEQLLQEETAARQYRSMDDRWAFVWSMPEGRELDRLITSSQEHYDRMAGLIDDMWAIPAVTEAGRSAKVSVVLSCILDWREPDEETDWRELMARRLLVDFVGGAEAQSFREIYA